MSEQRATRTVYLVICSEWSYNDEFFVGDDRPMKAFSRREHAEAYQAQCEARVRGCSQYLAGSQTDVQFHILETEVEV